MPYKIFVSHTHNDKLIVEEITSVINNAFEGDIEFYIASKEITTGMQWKNAIRENLKCCDALMCLVTPEYAQKPWLFIEWSAFWLADKTFYSLLTGDVKITDLVHPMQDHQVTYLLDEHSVRMFFRALAQDSKHASIPYKSVTPFIDAVRDSICLRDKEIAQKSFSRFKDNLDNLPSSDDEKKAVADYFYDQGDYQTYQQIAAKIRDDMVKYQMALDLVKSGDLNRIGQLTDRIVGADRLGEIALRLIDLLHHDSSLVRDIIDNIASKNQTELRKIAIHLLDRGESDTELFNFILDNTTNMTEIRKISCHLITNGKQDSPLFISLIKKATFFNQREAEKIMVELFHRDRQVFGEILESGIFTNHDVIDRLSDLHSE